jgi:tetratricopeptide (TPR) repeat protein
MRPPERRVDPRLPRRVLLIGWDAADWQLATPLIDRGLMPTLAGMIERGAWGNLASMRPMLSPLLWNTIATGKRPRQHGVHGFTEPLPDGSGIRPVSSASRRCKALWNMLTHCGMRSQVVGWYASHPAEPIAGVVVSNQFEQFAFHDGQLAPLAAGCVHPAELAEELADLRVTPGEIDASAILPFVPRAAELVARGGGRLGKLQHMLAQTATIHAAATHLLARDDWDFMSVYYEGIDRFGHEFMEFHPPRMEPSDPEEFELYQHCMTGIYRFHDMLLETLLRLAPPDAAVLVLSDHGYFNDHLRPDPRAGRSGPVDWHRPFGMFAACGAGIAPGRRVYGASLLDVAPTVLHLLGLPSGYDMPGRVLAEILVAAEPSPRIETWEEIAGPCGMHAAEDRSAAAEEDALVLEQLAALGYIDPPSEDAARAVRETRAANAFHLAQSLVEAQQFAEALEELQRLDAPFRTTSAARLLEATCQLAAGDRQGVRQTLAAVEASAEEQPRLWLLLGALEFAEGDADRALELFQRVAQADVRTPGLFNKLGEVYLATDNRQLAEEAFRKALATDGESPLAFLGLARARLKAGDAAQALEYGLIAAGLVHHFPRAHFVVGKALLALGDCDGAIEALELCIRQAPRMRAAHEALAEAHRAAGNASQALACELRAQGIVG